MQRTMQHRRCMAVYLDALSCWSAPAAPLLRGIFRCLGVPRCIAAYGSSSPVTHPNRPEDLSAALFGRDRPFQGADNAPLEIMVAASVIVAEVASDLNPLHRGAHDLPP